MKWKKIVTAVFIVAFLISFTKMIPPLNPTVHQLEEPTIFHTKDGDLYDNYALNYTITSYYNDTFTGFLKINNSTVSFNHCTFENDFNLEIYNSSTVTFFNSSVFDLSSPFKIYDNASVTIDDSTLESTSSVGIYNATATIDNSTFDLASLSIYGSANVTFSLCDLFDPPDDADDGDDDDADDGDDDEEADGHSLNMYGNASVSYSQCTLNFTEINFYENSTVEFTNSSPIYSDKITFYDNATVTFQNSSIITNATITDPGSVDPEIVFQHYVKVTFLNCTIETNEISIASRESSEINLTQSTVTVRPVSEDADPLNNTDLHRFKFIGHSKTIIHNSTINCPWDSLLKAEDHTNVTIRNHTTFNVGTFFRILNNATVTIDNSTMNVDAIFLSNQQIHYKADKPQNATLTVRNGAEVNGSIVDLGQNDKVSINDSAVNIVAETYWVNGTLTIFNNGTVSGTDYTTNYTDTFTIDETSTFTKQYAVIGLNESQIVIESPQLYGIVAACDSTWTIFNSTITDFVSAADLANVSLTDATILGKGGTAVYGAVQGMVATGGERIPGQFNRTSFISLHNCTISGKVRPSGDMTIVLQNSNYDEILKDLSLFGTNDALVVERVGIELNISGWIGSENITGANVSINDESVGNNSLYYTMDPVLHRVPGPAYFEIVAFNESGSFTRNFTIEIPSAAPTRYLLWNTTSDFQYNSFCNCTIGTNNLTLGKVGIAYDFTDDQNGSNPEGWTVSEPYGTSISVENNYTTHDKVVFLDDNNADQYFCSLHNDFEGRSYGAFEFWFLMPDVSCPLQFTFYNSEHTVIPIALAISYDYKGTPEDCLSCHNGTAWHNITKLSDDTWYHARLTFDCREGGGYDNLGQYEFNLYLNGTKYGSYGFYHNESDIGRLRIHTYDYPRQVSEAYIDAVDYSWTSGYYINRSYLDYGAAQEWIDYGIWRSQITDLEQLHPYYENITFSANTPANTSAYISYRMSNDSSSWVNYNNGSWESGWSAWTNTTISLNIFGRRYFQGRTLLNTSNVPQSPTLDWINVSFRIHFGDVRWDTTSEFENYEETNCTIVNGMLTLGEAEIAYDFTDDEVGSDPEGWTISEPGSTSISVENNYTTHDKVVFLDDDDTVLQFCSLHDDFDGKSYGAFEFWFLMPDVSCPLHFTFYNSEHTVIAIALVISYDYQSTPEDCLSCHNGTVWHNITKLSDDTWYHARLTFDCRVGGGYDNLSQYQFNLSLNGVKCDGSPFGFYHNESDIGRLRIHTYDWPRQVSDAYIDAVDYSWTDGYFPYRSKDYYGVPLYADMSIWVSNATDLEVTEPYYRTINFTCNTDDYTQVSISYCMSHNGLNWTTWSSGSSSNITLNMYGKRYVKVRAKLTTTNMTKTPELYTIEVRIYCF